MKINGYINHERSRMDPYHSSDEIGEKLENLYSH